MSIVNELLQRDELEAVTLQPLNNHGQRCNSLRAVASPVV